jgi:HEAT repeat protein
MIPARVIAGCSATACAGVLAVAAFAARDRLAEAWHLHRLGSTDSAARFRAAKRLGELRSVKAIPGLIELLRTLPEDAGAARQVWGSGASAGDSVAGVLASIGPPSVLPLARAIEESRGERKMWRRYACRALGNTKAEAAGLPLIAALDDPDGCVRMIVYQALASMGAGARAAVPAIASHLEDRDGFIRDAAARALKSIERTTQAGTAPSL